jgi:hypothetical protein
MVNIFLGKNTVNLVMPEMGVPKIQVENCFLTIKLNVVDASKVDGSKSGYMDCLVESKNWCNTLLSLIVTALC